MKLYFFSGPERAFFTKSLEAGEAILESLAYDMAILDPDEYTATEVEVELK